MFGWEGELQRGVKVVFLENSRAPTFSGWFRVLKNHTEAVQVIHFFGSGHNYFGLVFPPIKNHPIFMQGPKIWFLLRVDLD